MTSEEKDEGFRNFLRGASSYEIDEFDNSLEYLEKARESFEEIYGNTHPLLGQLYKLIGKCYYGKENYLKARDNELKANQISEKVYPNKNHPEIAECNYELGRTHMKLKEFENAKTFLEKAEEIYKTLGIEIKIVEKINEELKIAEENLKSDYFAIGLQNFKSGNLKNAYENFRNALKNAQLQKNTSVIIDCYEMIGLCFVYDRNLMSVAEHYMDKAFKRRKEYDTENLAKTYKSQAMFYEITGDLEKAYDCKKDEYKLRMNEIDQNTRLELAWLCIKLGKCQEGKTYLDEVVENDPKNAYCLGIIGKVYFKLGDYKFARKYLLEALDSNDIEKERNIKIDIFFHLGLTCQKTDQYDEANYYFEKCHENFDN